MYRSRTEGKNSFANLWCCDFKKLEALLTEWLQSIPTETQEVITEANEIASNRNKTKSNIVDSLIGAIPNTGKTLDDYHSERLEKYADNG